MPAHHDVRSSDVFTRRLHRTLAAAAERGPADFPYLLLTPGMGARTIRSLALVAEIAHGAPYRFRDPKAASVQAHLRQSFRQLRPSRFSNSNAPGGPSLPAG